MPRVAELMVWADRTRKAKGEKGEQQQKRSAEEKPAARLAERKEVARAAQPPRIRRRLQSYRETRSSRRADEKYKQQAIPLSSSSSNTRIRAGPRMHEEFRGKMRGLGAAFDQPKIIDTARRRAEATLSGQRPIVTAQRRRRLRTSRYRRDPQRRVGPSPHAHVGVLEPPRDGRPPAHT